MTRTIILGIALAVGAPAAKAQLTNIDETNKYAWGENIGWMNLDDNEKFVATKLCPPDFNNDGFLTIDDLFLYINAYFTGC